MKTSKEIIIEIKLERVRKINDFGITGSNLYNISNSTLRKILEDLKEKDKRW